MNDQKVVAPPSGTTCRIRHGYARKGNLRREWRIWTGLKDRCCNQRHSSYSDYGGRGVRLCERWRTGFVYFLQDMGDCPAEDSQIDRINGSGDYEPGNCRWVSPSDNCNNRCNNRLLTYQGETLTATQWARRKGVDAGLIYDRLDRQWSVERVLSQPARSLRRSPYALT